MSFTVLLFYKYVEIQYPKQILKWQRNLCEKLGLTGRIIIAHEGINATVSGTTENIERYCKEYLSHPLFGGTDIKKSPGTDNDFPKLSVKIRPEIVHLGLDTKEYQQSGPETHLNPDQVHELIENEKDLVIVDARNNYESRIGTFRNALTPDINSFREFPEYLDQNLEKFKDKKVLMFCTGGVRCERAVTYLQSKNAAQNVYQVEGGIVRYAEKYPDGHFRGKNYIFDNRIAQKITDDILSNCDLCQTPANTYTNCMNAFCNKHFIACDDCRESYQYTCSKKCQELVATGQTKVRTDRVEEKLL